MSYVEYPKVKYHAKHGERTVSHREAEDELGDDWHDTPGAAAAANVDAGDTSQQPVEDSAENRQIIDKTMERMTKSELVAFAAAAHDLTLDPKATKDQLLAQIQQAVDAKLATPQT